MTRPSEPDLLVLHAVRLLGFADSRAVADCSQVAHEKSMRLLQRAERKGWVQHVAFADLDGWSLTDAGRNENERQLDAERSSADPDGVFAQAYDDFLPLNSRLLRAVTDWQIRPSSVDQFASNDHSDSGWDGRALEELAALGEGVAPILARLADILARFNGYADRYRAALQRANDGEYEWIDRTDRNSCHRVWFQFHEDLVATLGIDRRVDKSGGGE